MKREYTTDPPEPGRAYEVRAYVRNDESSTGVRLELLGEHPIKGDWAAAVERVHAERSVDGEAPPEGGWPQGWYLDVDRLEGAKEEA